MLKEFRVKDGFKNFRNTGNKSNRTIVGGLRAVTLLRDRMNEGKLPARREDVR